MLILLLAYSFKQPRTISLETSASELSTSQHNLQHQKLSSLRFPLNSMSKTLLVTLAGLSHNPYSSLWATTKKRLYYAIQREKTDVHEEGDVIQWLNAEKGSIHCHQHKQMFVPIIYEGNQWCDKLHTTPRKSFCFPGSMSTWNHVGVLLFYGYPVIVPSSILNIILKDILSAWFVNSNPQTITNGNV